MTADNAQREPTMEEILASIRRIISEEDKPAEGGGDVLDLQPPAPPPIIETKAAPPPPAPRPEPKPEPIPEPAAAKAPPPPVKEEFVPPAPPPRPLDDELIIVENEAEPEAAPEPVRAAPRHEPRPVFDLEPETLTSAPVANAAAGALGKLMGSMLVKTGHTLDDVVREMMKPMLKEWLDANLPQVVEVEVAKEIERIRRLAR